MRFYFNASDRQLSQHSCQNDPKTYLFAENHIPTLSRRTLTPDFVPLDRIFSITAASAIWNTTFISRHADVFLCADLLTKEVWTLRGLQKAFVFFVRHLQCHRVLLAPAMFSSHGQWLKQQAWNALWECEEHGIEPRFFLHDRDACYAQVIKKDVWLKRAMKPLEQQVADLAVGGQKKGSDYSFPFTYLIWPCSGSQVRVQLHSWYRT